MRRAAVGDGFGVSALESAEFGPLRRLARRYRVLTRYRDGFKRFRTPSPEAVTAILRELGAAIETPADAPEALKVAEVERWSRLAPPTAVAWQGRAATIELRMLEDEARGELRCSLGDRAWTVRLEDLQQRGCATVDGRRRVSLRLPLPEALPIGRLLLELEGPSGHAETHVLSAPARCHSGPDDERLWGVFLPLYALHSERSWGAGDFSDLGALFDWTRERGGSIVGTLPMLAAFLDEPLEYSPYVPASRLFWNEFYVDPRATPEWPQSEAARATADGLADEIAALRAEPLVDYRRQARVKRAVLEKLSRQAWQDAGRREAIARAAAERPELEVYARFRAVTEKRGETWPSWEQPQVAGRLSVEDSDLDAERYHLYAQFVADEQLAALAARAGEPGLYLDLPLGTHPGGFDVWREPDAFAAGVSGGAPPDRFFTQGQDWSFSPLHPEAGRRDGHAHFSDCLDHHLKHAGVLRIDHFMGLHRLYWIPRGLPASEGTYVQYPAEELYAAVAIASRKHRARIVGEDLGTVPKYVRRRMRERAIDRMYVAQFSFRTDKPELLEEAPEDSLAGVNTHDTPTFRAFWEGLDVDAQVEMNLIDEQEAETARRGRAALRARLVEEWGIAEDSAAAYRAVLERIARSPARAVMVTLEDLWDETEPQNTPGTGQEKPNWRRKAAKSLEEIQGMAAPIER